ncbi:MAG: hypothetical protein ACLFTG_10985 [Alphaproteobacteria bacterium]
MAAAVAFVIGAATPAFIIERELHEARIKLLRSRQALARTLDILEQHTAPPVRPDGGMRDIAADGGPTAGHVHIARVIVRDPAGRLHMRSVETPDARTCVVVARMLVARADAAPEFEAVGGGCVDGYRA